MYQEMFLNCPVQVYKTNAKEYKKTKTFVENMLKKEECGNKMKDMFLLDPSFWTEEDCEIEDAEDDQ